MIPSSFLFAVAIVVIGIVLAGCIGFILAKQFAVTITFTWMVILFTIGVILAVGLFLFVSWLMFGRHYKKLSKEELDQIEKMAKDNKNKPV